MARGAVNGCATETDAGGRAEQVVVFGEPGTDNVFGVVAARPLFTTEPVKGDALGKGGLTSSGSSQQVAAANANRKVIEVSNGGTTAVWLAFGSSAVAGQGSLLPPNATGYWPTTAAVNCINAAGGSNGPVGYTEW